MRALDPPIPLASLADAIGANCPAASRDLPVERLATLVGAGPRDLSFFSDPRYSAQLEATRAAAVIVRAADAGRLPAHCVGLLVDDPYLAFAKAAESVAAHLKRPEPPGIDASACVHAGCRLGEGVAIGPGAVIGDGAALGDGVTIGPGVVVGDGVSIGQGSRLNANVTVYSDCWLGESVLVHSGTVIGADGFGFARDGTGWRKIAQLGCVHIGNRVEIGANCAIDRGALDDTVVGDDCIVDNLVQIAHNVRIGAGSALAGCVGVAGSAVIGERCLIGGGAGVLGHLEIVDEVIVSPMSLVTRSIKRSGFYSGSFPLMENARWERAGAVLRQLPDMRARLRALEKLTRKPS